MKKLVAICVVQEDKVLNDKKHFLVVHSLMKYCIPRVNYNITYPYVPDTYKLLQKIDVLLTLPLPAQSML